MQDPFTEVLTCKDVIALLSEYLEATLGAHVTESLEGHLRGCDECVAYVNTYRKTRELTARLGRVEMPAGMRERLRDFLLVRLGAPSTVSPTDVLASDPGKAAVRALDLDALPWTERGAARLKELSAYGKRLRIVEFGPGFSDPNWCRKGHVVYVLDGVIESEYDDGDSSRRAGEAYIIPAGVKHRSRNPHGVPATLLIVDDA